MATLDDVARIAACLPGVVEGERQGRLTWSVGGKVFAWERAFSKADLKRFGTSEPPSGPILAVRVEDLHEKEAVLAAGQPGIFHIPHFDGFSAVLVQLSAIDPTLLEETLVDGWLACAPRRLAAEYLGGDKGE